jgi:hydroxyacylglutathione hydrolase
MRCRVLVASFCLGACGGERGGPGVGGGGVSSIDGASGASAGVSGSAAIRPDPSGGVASGGTSNEGGASPSGGAGESGGDMPSSDAGTLGGGGQPSVPDAAAGLVMGSLAVAWMHGAANCSESTDQALQIHRYNATTYIIRQDKCRTFEAPFVYLLLGTQTALLLDTGATNDSVLRDAVLALADERELLVAHTHAHGDHVASDEQFVGRAATTVVGAGASAVQAAFGIAPWPTGTAELDLGARVLDVLAIPGHEQSHIALYDRETGLLFTGDSLYPGLLFINDWTTYRASMRRLAEFVAAHEVTHVLGAHIEMTSTPGINYSYGSTFQPDEHVLELDAAHVVELDAALTALGPAPPAQPMAHEDFVIDPQ